MLALLVTTRRVAKNGIVTISSPRTPSPGMRWPCVFVSVRYSCNVSKAALVCWAGHIRKKSRTLLAGIVSR